MDGRGAGGGEEERIAMEGSRIGRRARMIEPHMRPIALVRDGAELPKFPNPSRPSNFPSLCRTKSSRLFGRNQYFHPRRCQVIRRHEVRSEWLSCDCEGRETGIEKGLKRG